MPKGVMTNYGELLRGESPIQVLEKNSDGDYFLLNDCISYETDLKLAPSDKQPWLLHMGGECPVPENVRVEVCLRNKVEFENELAKDIKWSHYFSMSDVIRFRVVGVAA